MFRQLLQDTADIFIVHHAKYDVQLLVEFLMKEIQLSTDIFDAIYIMSRVANDIRIAMYLLPASHQSGKFAHIGKTIEIVFGTDAITYFSQFLKSRQDGENIFMLAETA